MNSSKRNKSDVVLWRAFGTPQFTAIALVLTALTVDGCAPAGTNRVSTTEDAFGGTKCHAYRPPTEPDLMGWDSGSRANLVRLKGDGAVVVRYNAQGCNVELEVLSNCSAPAEYKFTPYSANDHKVMNTVEQLYSQLPVGATSLAAKLKNSRSLRTDYMMAGILSLKAGSTLGRNKLKGDCSKATHVVSAIYVGGFAMAAGSANEVQGALSIFGVGVGGGKSTSLEQVSSEGSAAACEQSQKNLQPNEGCSVPLRLGLTSIADVSEPEKSDSPPSVAATTARSIAVPGGRIRSRYNSAGVDSVTVVPFEMDVMEVTVAMYGVCVDAGKCSRPASEAADCNWGVAGRESHPINCVDWNQAAAFCSWVKKRLPTVEEWELAAAQPTQTYPWGNEAPTNQLCWKKTSQGHSCPSGSYPSGRSPVGILDLSGNVREWVSTVYRPLRGDPLAYEPKDKKNPPRLVKGGAWDDADPSLVSSGWAEPKEVETRDSFTGFRCARGKLTAHRALWPSASFFG